MGCSTTHKHFYCVIADLHNVLKKNRKAGRHLLVGGLQGFAFFSNYLAPLLPKIVLKPAFAFKIHPVKNT